MADASKTVEIVFFGKDEITKTINGIENSIESLNNLADPFADMAKSILALEAAVAGLALGAANIAGEFDQASKQLGASLGASEEDVKALESVYKEVFKTGIVDSVEEAAAATSEAFKRFGADADLSSIVVVGEQLQKTFGVELTESFNAAQTLVKNFGISTEEAFDLIVSGFQKGLNNSDDFLESVNEYSTQFANGGANAKQFFSVLSTGYQAGVLGTDKAADAFKEFRVRIQDGSKTTSEALELIGIDSQNLAKQFSDGSITAVEAFDIVVGALNNTKDSSKVLQAGVGLLGTQFEDLGTQSALALSTTSKEFENVEGAAGNLVKNFSGVGKSVSSLVNTLKVEISELDIWDDLFKSAQENIEKIRDIIPEVLEQIDFSELLDSFSDLGDSISNLFGNVDITDADDLKDILQDVVNTMESLQDLTTGIIDGLAPFFALIGDGIQNFNDLDEGTKQLIGTIGGLSIGFTAVYAAITPIIAALSGTAGLVVAAVAAGGALGTLLNKLDSIRESAQYVIEALDGIFKFTDSKTKEELAEIDKNFQTAREQAKQTRVEVEKLQQQEVELNVEYDDITNAAKEAGVFVDEITKAKDETKTPIKAVVDANTEPAVAKIENFVGYVNGEPVYMDIDADTSKAEKEIKDLSEKGELKKFEIEADIDKTKIEEETKRLEIEAEKLSESFKYKADVDITQAEAAAKIMQSSFESVANTIATSGENLTGLLDSLASAPDLSTKFEIQEQIRKQERIQEEQLELQRELTEAQIANLEAMTKLAESGDITIKVEGISELEPALEMMWDVMFKYTQAKLNAVGFAGLLGVPA
jgi:phage-related minor tail protein